MKRTIIKRHSTSIIKSLITKIESLSDMEHNLTKGELRELFVTDVLKSFIPNQFTISSGIIINTDGDQSKQMDIIIYDNRILPPFIKEQNIGLIPAESVIATIEVKSHLTGKDIKNAEESAKLLHEKIYNPFSGNPEIYKEMRPLCAIIGFYGYGAKGLSNEKKGKTWLSNNIFHIKAICLVERYSWLMLTGEHGPNWTLKLKDKETCEETKRFIAALIDNILTKSRKRFQNLLGTHEDWLTKYIRDQ